MPAPDPAAAHAVAVSRLIRDLSILQRRIALALIDGAEATAKLAAASAEFARAMEALAAAVNTPLPDTTTPEE